MTLMDSMCVSYVFNQNTIFANKNKRMKTTYLDNEIILLEGYKKEGRASFYQLRKLAEYREIKQLIIASVVGQSEQLVCDKNELDCPYDFTSRCTMGRCDCKPKAN